MLREKAYAKINLFLNVIGKRSDGYHDLEMVMAPISLYDNILLKPRKDKEIRVLSSIEITSKQEDNIVFKVAAFMQKEYGIETGVDIIIDKRIPIGAGLAGGSADAAATLRGLNKLWKLKLSLDEMAKLGLEFGADIPFCIYNKLCIARGKGENLHFLNKTIKLPILIVYPNIHMSTKAVFEKTKLIDKKEVKVTRMAEAVYNRNYELIVEELYNSLEAIVFEMEPTIQRLKEQMQGTGVKGVLMSGSGSTVFAICKDKNKLRELSHVLDDSYIKKIVKIK